ncbi:Fe-S-containing hydro-lyase [Ruminococcaceae bacterium OttesenSCG-928-I18]|nr:Fe-S-containing hydro-lyase [Ruminococcaceae bacterium OttesenSCG-928-I18]
MSPSTSTATPPVTPAQNSDREEKRMEKRIVTPFLRKDAEMLRVGDQVLLSGTVYTARDAAHARLVKLLEEGRALPLPLRDSILYYVGPTPAKPDEVIGSAGPTTSYRMDRYTPLLIERGLRGMIGKGARSREVVESMKKHGAVYFGALGGAGALLSQKITSCRVVCYEDLGAEAIHELTVVHFPVTVAIDTQGNNLYDAGPAAYLQSLQAKKIYPTVGL